MTLRLPGFGRGSSFYIVGRHYHSLLEEVGQSQEAAHVMQRLDALVVSPAAR